MQSKLLGLSQQSTGSTAATTGFKSLRTEGNRMKLSATREQILTPLQSVIGVVERRQTMPVLSNVLLAARNRCVSVTGTDLEVELVATGDATVQQPGDITVPGRKLLDIFRAIPEKTAVTIATDGERVSIKAGKSRFTLSTLPATEFPIVEEINAQQTLTLSQGFSTFDRQDALFDGTARRSLLFERTSARNRWEGVACRGHRWSSPGAVRGGARDERPEQPASVLARRESSNFSAF